MSGLYIGLASLAVGAGGSIYGASQQPDEIGAHQLQSQFFDPTADPLLAMLSMNAGTGIGMYDPGFYRGASPAQQFLASLGATGQVDRRRMRLFNAAIAEGIADPESLLAVYATQRGGGTGKAKHELGVDPRGLRDLDKLEDLVISNGYGSLEEFFQEEQAYRAKQDEIRAQFEPVAEQMRQGILASQGRMAGYLQDLPNLLTGEANPFKTQLREQALAQAQKYGANPYAFLEQADATALSRALQLIGGEQAALAGPMGAAQSVAALRQQGGATSAQVGGAQAQMLAQLLMNNQATQANQANAWGNIGNTIGAYGLIGADMWGNRGPAAGSDPDPWA